MKQWKVYDENDKLIGGVETDDDDSGEAEKKAIEEYGDGVWVMPV